LKPEYVDLLNATFDVIVIGSGKKSTLCIRGDPDTGKTTYIDILAEIFICTQ
jgi:hypothetical protein